MTSLDLTLYERCPRIPALLRAPDPPAEPIRAACRRFFYLGLSQIFLGYDVSAPVDFLTAAANGFIYPLGAEPYLLANDYATWLDGALHMVAELNLVARQAPALDLAPDSPIVLAGAWQAASALHLFLAGGDLNSWPVWLAQLSALDRASSSAVPLIVHQFTLPSARNGRLTSPLTCAFRHPHFNLLRLAPLDSERQFSPKWQRVYRHADQSFLWPEWREGIRRDNCEDQIWQHHSLYDLPPATSASAIRADALAIIRAISLPHPRLRERCLGCQFAEVCHAID